MKYTFTEWVLIFFTIGTVIAGGWVISMMPYHSYIYNKQTSHNEKWEKIGTEIAEKLNKNEYIKMKESYNNVR